MLALWLATCLGAGEVFVAPTGDDAAAGTLAAPLRTFARARATHATTVWLRGGTYTERLVLDAADNGTVWRRYGDETVRLCGGRRLQPTDLRPVTDAAVLARLDPAARGHVVEVDTAALGLVHTKRWPDVGDGASGLVELLWDGRRLPLSRYPRDGFMTMKRVLANGEGAQPGVFEYRDDRTLRWQAAVRDGLWLKGYWRVAWQNEAIRVAAIDPQARTITFAKAIPGGIGSKYKRPAGSGDERYWALNLLEELVAPGQWCLNFASGKLYLWPPDELARHELLVVDQDQPLVSVHATQRVQLRGLTLEGGLGNGLEVVGGEGVVVRGCTVRNVAQSAIVVRGGRAHEVRGCDLHALGAAGVEVSGGERPSLTPCEHLITNNHIHHFGELKRVYAAAVDLTRPTPAVGVRVTHNLIHDAPHVGILYAGNDNLFEDNEIFRVCLVSNDMGGFYSGGSWTSYGNVIRHNFVHHSPQAHGCYVDDGGSGIRCEHNLFWGLDAGVFIGGGHDNLASGNLAVDCRKALHLDCRGVARGYNAANKRMVGELAAVNYRQPPWSTRFPTLMALPETHPDWPTGCRLTDNAGLRCGKLTDVQGTREQLQFTTVADNLQYATGDLLANLAGLDLRWREDSPLLRDRPRWERWALERVGLMLDEDRTVLPRAEELRRDSAVAVDQRNDADPLNAG